jgi:hypothetical protein
VARRGTTGTPMTTRRIKRPACKHKWTEWRRTGMLDSTERRDCKLCKRIQTRKPKAKT